jgi:Cu/Ag efflux protein CusF
MEYRVRRNLAATAAALALGVGLSIAGPATSAHATAADCSGGANGFIDISDDASGSVVRSVDMGAGRAVTLQHGTIRGLDRGWAKISGTTVNGDLVWMDWTTNNGSTWLQCGPFAVNRGPGTSKTSAAKATSSSSSYRFRACGYLKNAGQTKCTSWW